MINPSEMTENKFMTNEAIAKQAPSVFTESPSGDVSKHYTHIPTTKVIDDMRTLGWDVINVQEVKARRGVGFQKHLVVFRNNDIVINGEDNDTVYPQILLTNSHDGKNAFQLQAGLYRLICSNGLVIATTQFEAVKMRHMGYTFEDLQENIREMVLKLPLTVESMNVMKATQLGEAKALEFAKECLKTRFTEEQIKSVNINLEDLLFPTRSEDKGKDLWSVFNVGQEKIIEGDFSYMSGGKIRKARKIKNFRQDQKINSELFGIALEYAQ